MINWIVINFFFNLLQIISYCYVCLFTLVIFDTYTNSNENYVDLEELNKLFRLIFFNKKEQKRLYDILVSKYNNLKNSKLKKIELLDFFLESDEIQEIFYKDFHNEEEVDYLYEEEISLMCKNNMKKSK